MTNDLENIGTLVTAGLAAAEVGRSSLDAHGVPASGGICANCGNTLTGRYCQACGQVAHLHRSLLHLMEELLHNVLHFDAKGWRTLPLLAMRPGLLTRRYIDGQRTRYVSPLALFLFTGFLMFFVVSLTVEHTHASGGDPAARAAAHTGLAANVEESKEEVAHAEDALERARHAGRDTQEAQEALTSAQQEQRVAEAAQKWADAAMSATAAPTTGEPTAGVGISEAGARMRALADWADNKLDSGSPRIDALIRRAVHNPELFLYRLENTAYKFLFLLIPISLPFLWLMFVGRRDVAVYDHAVFSLYSLSFMSLLIVACALLGTAGFTSLAVLLVIFVPPLHMFLQLRGTYRLGIFSSLWRTVMLLGIAGTAFLVFVVFILVMSLR